MVTLQSGDKAPAFSALNQNGEKISLSDFKDKKLILFFYPQAVPRAFFPLWIGSSPIGQRTTFASPT